MPVADMVDHKNQRLQNIDRHSPETASDEASSDANNNKSDYVESRENSPTVSHTTSIDQQIGKLKQMHLDIRKVDEFQPREPITQGSELPSPDISNPYQDDDPPNQELSVQENIDHIELAAGEADSDKNHHDDDASPAILAKPPLTHSPDQDPLSG